ncbi:ABC transporter ATP-binding protein [Actinomadura sp. 9N407]|uniref:ABC transporter ATP-binding protein n=1 Tax=Actinomadura sp. 9N407 TaxID=3375154 RepID=UPI0037A117C8
MLQIQGLSRHFGGVYAVRDVDLTVGERELRGIIGPNGAGKSTLFNLIAGHLLPDQGTIEFRGHRLGRQPAHSRAALGIAIVFQAARVFRGMSVRENVMVGAHAGTRAGFLTAALRLPGHARDERLIRARADAALKRVGLSEWAGRPAESLPLGQQRSLQLARALCAEPELLLLDEPASGLRSAERRALSDLIAELRRSGLTIMLVEHDVAMVTRLADRITVLDLGQVIADGTPDQIRSDPRVIAAYLGEEVTS